MLHNNEYYKELDQNPHKEVIIEKRISFYSNNLDLLPPKPKISFRHLKQGIQQFHEKFVLAPADKAGNNAIVVWRLHYSNTLKSELNTAKTYELISLLIRNQSPISIVMK